MNLRDMPGLGDGLDLTGGGEKGTRMTPKSLVCGTGWRGVPFTGQGTLENYQI